MPVQSPLLKSSSGLANTGGVRYGDIDGNGNISATDAYKAQLFFLGKISLTPEQQKRADVNGDGRVDATDALLIEKYALGEIDQFPVEKEEREPQKVRDLRADIASLQTEISMLRPFGDLPPWRRKRLKNAVSLAGEANILVEDEASFSKAKAKYDKALRLFKDDQPPENTNGGGSNGGSNGGSSNGQNGGSSGGQENGGGESSVGSGDSEQMVSGVDNTTLVLGAGVAATGIIALIASRSS